VLQLLAILSAVHFVETKRERFFWISAALCGAALGMVLSALWVFLILPVAWLQVDRPGRAIVKAVLGGLVGGGVYCLTNPYVPINLIRQPNLVVSNLGNSSAMYHVSDVLNGAVNSIRLIAEGTTTPLAIVGLAGLFLIIKTGGRRSRRAEHSDEERWARQERRPPGTAPILLAAGVPVVLQMILLGAGKPPEYARFGLLVDVLLAIAAIIVVLEWTRYTLARLACACLLGWTFLAGVQYLDAFLKDCRPNDSRYQAAATIAIQSPHRIGLPREPAPYNVPPVDLFQTRLFLLPKDDVQHPDDFTDMIVYPVESLRPWSLWQTPMSWASTTFEIRQTTAPK
jgi:hypothetical protein